MMGHGIGEWECLDDDDTDDGWTAYLSWRDSWLYAVVRPRDEYRAQVRDYDMGRPAEVIGVRIDDDRGPQLQLQWPWPSLTQLWLDEDDVVRVDDARRWDATT